MTKVVKKASGFIPKFFFIVWICLQGCSTVANIRQLQKEPSVCPNELQWQQLAPPVHCFRYENKKERLRYTLVRIDLSDSRIVVDGIPSRESPNGTIKAVSLKRRAVQTDVFLAVNATPFDYAKRFCSNELRLCGLYIYDGRQISAARHRYAALCFDTEKRAYIVNSQTDVQTAQARFAFGGFWTILENDAIGEFKDIRNARTAAGIGEDGHTLYLLAVEKNLFSSGLSFANCALILKNAGAVHALQFDGGRSVNLIFPDFPAYSVQSRRKTANALTIRYLQKTD